MAISKKLRFEVFKRDRFQCQYCGKKAPDVVLHVDHIHPVSKGGEDTILNLVTACQGCNLGKSNRTLDDATVLEKQHEELSALQERREQLEAMLEWREQLQTIETDVVSAFVDEVQSLLPITVNDAGRTTITRWLKKYTLEELLKALDSSVASYASRDNCEFEDYLKAFEMVPRIAAVERRGGLSDTDKAIFYIRGILRNRLSYLNEQMCISVMRDAHDCGVDLEIIKDCALSATSWTKFREAIDWHTDRLEAVEKAQTDWQEKQEQERFDELYRLHIEERWRKDHPDPSSRAWDDDGYDDDGYGYD